MQNERTPQTSLVVQGVFSGWDYSRNPEGIPVVQELAIDVPNLNDEWLTHPDRMPEEVDAVLEGRLHGIQLSFISDEGNALRDLWGIQTPVDLCTARTLAYAEMFHEYHQVSRGARTKLEQVESEFQLKKEELKSLESKKQISRERRINQTTRFRKESDQKKTPYIAEHDRAVRIQQLLGHKMSIEYFDYADSQKPIGRMEAITGVVNRFTDDVGEDFSYAQSATTALIEALTQTINQEAGTGALPYKRDRGCVKILQDTSMLEYMMNMHFQPESLAHNHTAQQLLQHLSSVYFDRQLRDAVRNSQISQGSNQPVLTLLYDMAAITTNRGDIRHTEQVRDYINRCFTPVLKSSSLRPEIHQFIQGSSNNIRQYFEYLSKIVDTHDPVELAALDNATSEFISNRFHDESHVLSTGLLTLQSTADNANINSGWTGLTALRGLKASHDTAMKKLAPELASYYRDYASFEEATAAYSVYPAYIAESSTQHEINLFAALIRMDHDTEEKTRTPAFDLIQRRIQPYGQRVDKKTSRVQDVYQRFTDSEYGLTRQHIAELLRVYSRNYWNAEISQQEIDYETSQQRKLWHEILDNSQWFVSPRGDRFLARHDAEMREQGIESITFRIDRDHPREHIADVLIQGLPQPIRLILDTNRNIYVDPYSYTGEHSRNPLLIDQRIKLQFTNLIMKRLYAITSGLYKQEENTNVHTDNESGDPEIYRRACYLKYGSAFHLTSEAALQHKREIKEEYNIDIDLEQKRRREAGTLRYDEKLSFRRETVPARMQGTYVPNILVYDPLRIHV